MQITKTQLMLNPDEMAFRKIYWQLLEKEKITTVFRPGKRLSGMPKAYMLDQIVYAKVIDNIGADWAGVPPLFVSDLSKTIQIKSIKAKRIGDLELDDFRGSSPDVFNADSLRFHLGAIYNLYESELRDEAWVTVIKFEYVNMNKVRMENSQETFDLLSQGVLSFAKKPENNPQALSFNHYAITLIEHDYAGKTPKLWNNTYENVDLPYANAMLVGDISQMETIVQALRKDSRYIGGGAGVGFKDEIIKHLDEVDPIAEKIGAVNFVLKTSAGKLKGYNTDGMGYAASVQNLFSQLGRKVDKSKAVILGAGGTGNAIAFMLAKIGMKVVISNRSLDKAEKLALRINQHFSLKGESVVRAVTENQLPSEVENADLVVNVSTKGATGILEHHHALAPAEISDDEELHEVLLKKNHQQAEEIFNLIPRDTIISDIVLRNDDTPLIKRAKELGFKTLDGIPMVVGQATEAFWLLHAKELKSKGITKNQIAEIMRNTL
jgi:shikimate dehydrogenase